MVKKMLKKYFESSRKGLTGWPSSSRSKLTVDDLLSVSGCGRRVKTISMEHCEVKERCEGKFIRMWEKTTSMALRESNYSYTRLCNATASVIDMGLPW